MLRVAEIRTDGRTDRSQQTRNICITLHLYSVGLESSTLVQHCTNVIQMFCAGMVPRCFQTLYAFAMLKFEHRYIPSKHDTLNQCRFNVSDVGPTLNRHWFSVSCLLGYSSANDQRCPRVIAVFLGGGGIYHNVLYTRCDDMREASARHHR